MKKLLFLSFTSIILIRPIATSGQEVIYKYLEAHNSHDVKKELSYYDPEIVFEIENTWKKQGIKKMQELAKWDSTLNSNLKFEIIERRNDSLICKMVENNDWFSAIGIHNMILESTLFVFRDEKIYKIVAHPSSQIAEQVSIKIQELIAWSKKNNDSTISRLLSDGQFVYSSKTALEWLTLFDKWKRQCDTLIFRSNDSKLKGYFYSSNQVDAPTLIFTQGFMDTGDIWDIGVTLSKKGINVFQFDFRGCHKSEGKQGLMNSQEDIEAALVFLTSTEITKKYAIDTANIIVGGYSYGGHMSMLFAINHPKIKKVISVSGGDLGIFGDLVKSNSNLRKDYSDFFQSIKKPNGPVDFEYDDPIQELIDNQKYFYILKQVDSLSNVNIFLTGGLDDNVVNMEDYILPLYRALKRNKSLNVECKVYQSGHSYKRVSDKLLKDIENWIKKG